MDGRGRCAASRFVRVRRFMKRIGLRGWHDSVTRTWALNAAVSGERLVPERLSRSWGHRPRRSNSEARSVASKPVEERIHRALRRGSILWHASFRPHRAVVVATATGETPPIMRETFGIIFSPPVSSSFPSPSAPLSSLLPLPSPGGNRRITLTWTWTLAGSD